MIPIRDDQPTFGSPALTYFLIAFNLLIFLFETTLTREGRNDLYARFALIPNHVALGPLGHRGAWTVAVFTIFTAMFLHSGWAHVVWNMGALWVFGDNIEDHLGRFPYLFFYLACGLGAAAFHLLFNWRSSIPTVGASGAIAGVMGAYLLLYPRARVLFFFLALPAWVVLGFWIVVQLLSGVAESVLAKGPGTSGGIAIWAHVGGFVAGMILIKLLPERKGRYRYGTW